MSTLDAFARRAVDVWSQIVGTAPDALSQPGVTVVPRDDDRPAVGWLRAVGTVVTAPDRLVRELRELGDAADDLDRVTAALGDRVTRTTGPARIGWLPEGWSPPEEFDATRLGITAMSPDDHRLRAFHNRLPPTDQDAWAVRGHHGHALVRGGRIIGAAMVEDVRGVLAHLGVATATDHRLQGHAVALVTAASDAAVARETVPQYRTLESNRGGWRVALSVGFREGASQALLHLRR